MSEVKVRVKINRAGFRGLLTDAEVVADLYARASAIADACNEQLGDIGSEPGYVAAAEGRPRRRARAAVVAVGMHARRDNEKHNTMLKHLLRGQQ